jgi:prolyl-tRNA synthetase
MARFVIPDKGMVGVEVLTNRHLYGILNVMKFKQSLISTAREDPKEAETKSHRILLRGGFIRQLASGVNIYLPLGWRVLKRIEKIIREEHERIGAQELLMPAISPKEIWQESGRWAEYGDDMFRFKDRRGRDFCLCPTHEEIITEIARKSVRSYRDLPQIWFQIQMKFRDELRPRFGVIRSRQFIMKDSYSLDRDKAGLDKSFDLHKEAYIRIFKRCGLQFEIVEASGGLMGTGESKEFVARVAGAEDTIVSCSRCDYRANIEAARGKGEKATFKSSSVEEISTSGKKTVDEVSGFLNVSPRNLVKTMFCTAPEKEPVIILLRGDYEMNESALHAKLGFSYVQARPEEVVKYFGAEPGYIGPVGKDAIVIYADDLLKGSQGMITGANKNDYHIKGLDIERDINVKEYHNFRKVKSGDKCVHCGAELELHTGLELGHIFKLGTKYSETLGATFLDEHGSEKPIVMGSYGIGLERIMACVCEQKGDEKGAVWPISIAPYEVYLLVLNPSDKDVKQTADDMAHALQEQGFSFVLDDRDLSAGIKFKDSELLGMPLRLTIGPKGIKQNKYDVYVRETGEVHELTKEAVVEKCSALKETLQRSLYV